MNHLGDYNKVILLGNATRDAEIKIPEGGTKAYGKFAVGISSSSKQGKSFYIDVLLFNKVYLKLIEYVKKGRRLLVEGLLDKDRKGKTIVIAERIAFQDKRPTDQKPQQT